MIGGWLEAHYRVSGLSRWSRLGSYYESGRLLELYQVQMGSTSDRLGPPIIVAIVAISATVVTLLLKLNISCVPRVGVIITIVVQYLVVGHLS